MRTEDDLSRHSGPEDAPEPQALGVVRIVLLSLWAFASFGTCYFAREFHWGPSGRPLAYAVVGQGLLLMFITIVVVNALVFDQDDQDDQAETSVAGRAVRSD